MNNFFEKKNLEKLWWYGLNIITTLFIVSFVNFNAPQGEPGLPGSNGVNGVDGQDGQDGGSNANLYPVSGFPASEAPIGDARQAYVQARIEEGYVALSSIEDFDIFTESEAAYEANYVLTNDIDFLGVEIGNDYSPIPGFISVEIEGTIEQISVPFNGVFDGAGYAIKNIEGFYGEYSNSVGFIPSSVGAVVRNLSFENLRYEIIFTSHVGGVIGFVDGPTLIENVKMINTTLISEQVTGGIIGVSNDDVYLSNVEFLSGNLWSAEKVGGFIGYQESDYEIFIQNSLFQGSIDRNNIISSESEDYFYTDSTYAGGFIGYVENANQITIYESINAGRVHGDADVGGFIGYLNNAKLVVIANSYNAGSIDSEGDDAGGYIGDTIARGRVYIQNSYNAGPIHSGEDAVGGFIGEFGDSEENTKYAPTLYISNSYNAGNISAQDFGDERGGLIGYVFFDENIWIQDSFQVGTFSESITSFDQDRNFPTNGAIIGDVQGTFSVDNVRYFYDEDNADSYLDHAFDNTLDRGVTQTHDVNDFTSEAFYLESEWDMENVWTFRSGSYAFPVLKELTFKAPQESESKLPIFYGELWWYEVLLNEETNENEVIIWDAVLEAGDPETLFDELTVQIILSFEQDLTLETYTNAETEVAFEFFGRLYVWDEVVKFVPGLGSGTYYMYGLVTDSDGNQVFEAVQNGVIIYTDVLQDLEAPVPGNEGALAVSIDMPRALSLTFTRATDNVTAQDDLEYFFFVATTEFDWEAWDISETDPNILFADTFTTTSDNYSLSLDFDADYNYTYEVLLFVSDAAGNLAAYQFSSFIYID